MIESHYCWPFEDSKKEYCITLTQVKPNDVHNMLSKRISNMLNRDITRDHAKSVKYSVTYGAQKAKISSIIGCDESVGGAVYDAFWEAAKPLALLLENVTNYWETEGNKSCLVGIDGRRLNTRAKHSILNTLFQSAGVICAKTTMVWQDIMLRREGLSVCFWTDDYKNKQYAQQLIAYHK